jgi:hypothetical protein
MDGARGLLPLGKDEEKCAMKRMRSVIAVTRLCGNELNLHMNEVVL